jgi:hypothetical protein
MDEQLRDINTITGKELEFDDVSCLYELLIIDDASHGGTKSSPPTEIVLQNENDSELIPEEQIDLLLAELFQESYGTPCHRYCVIMKKPWIESDSIPYVPLSFRRKNRPKGLKYNTKGKKIKKVYTKGKKIKKGG